MKNTQTRFGCHFTTANDGMTGEFKAGSGTENGCLADGSLADGVTANDSTAGSVLASMRVGEGMNGIGAAGSGSGLGKGEGSGAGKGYGPWASGWRRFVRNRPAMVGLCGVMVMVLAALLAPFITEYGYDQQLIWTEGKSAQLQPPSGKHWFGTDYYGRDIFTRVVYGSRVSLITGIASTGIAMLIGVSMGVLAGYYGGFIDDFISWAINVVFAFPFLLFVLALVAYLPQGMGPIYAAIGIVNWAPMARVVRGQVLSVRERDYVQAAMLLGIGDFRVLFRHIMPNVLAPVIVQSTLGMGNIIMLEASLSFLGFGIQPPTPSWGYMIDQGRQFLLSGHWWWSVFPGLAIMLLVLSFNLLGDGLRDALDPRLNGNQ
jgi:ABC-type dipeptide/oligopeptide/nickel transport system permease subunit